MTTFEESLGEVLEEIKGYYNRLTDPTSEKISLARKVVREKKLAGKIGAYVIYDNDRILYAGSSKDLEKRLVKYLYNPDNHIFSWRLLREEVGKRKNIEVASDKLISELKKKKDRNYYESREAVRKRLETYQFRFHEIEGSGTKESRLAKALLLEALVITVLEPMYNIKALEEKLREEE